MMGTFTKSFGAMGGYIAGSRELVEHVRQTSAGFLVDNAMAPVVCQQVLTSFAVLRGEDGTDIGAQKLRLLRENSNYFRQRLIDMGCDVAGEWDSPVIPVMLYTPTNVAAFSRECLKRGVSRLQRKTDHRSFHVFDMSTHFSPHCGCRWRLWSSASPQRR
jgi:serine palmitoyltransferase